MIKAERVLVLMNRVRYIRKKGIKEHIETEAEKLLGKRVRDMTEEEKRAYQTYMKRKSREKKNNNR